MKRWALVAMMLLAGLAIEVGAQVNTSGLTKEQKAELELKAAEMRRDRVTGRVKGFSEEEEIASPKVKADDVERWAKLGENIGKSLGAAAKEVGVAVNDFAKTPVGILTTVLIVWHFMGATLMKLIIGAAVMLVLIPLWFYIFRRYALKMEVTSMAPEKGWLSKTVTKYDADDGRVWSMLIGLAVMLFVTTLMVIK